MKTLTLPIVALAACSLVADEAPPVACSSTYAIVDAATHHVQPKFFYSNHKEGGYTYTMYGLGIGYHYKQEEGLNFKCALASNFNLDKPFVEEDLSISYAFSTIDKLSIMPYLATKNATHHINTIEQVKNIVTKGSLYAGIGIKPTITTNVDTEIKIGFSRDLYNILMHSSDTTLVGRKFSNPFGFIAEISVGLDVIDRLKISVDGNFARGFKGEFRHFGGSLAGNWRF